MDLPWKLYLCSSFVFYAMKRAPIDFKFSILICSSYYISHTLLANLPYRLILAILRWGYPPSSFLSDHSDPANVSLIDWDEAALADRVIGRRRVVCHRWRNAVGQILQDHIRLLSAGRDWMRPRRWRDTHNIHCLQRDFVDNLGSP